MKNKTILALVLAFVTYCTQAQSNAEKLYKANKMYGEMQDFADSMFIELEAAEEEDWYGDDVDDITNDLETGVENYYTEAMVLLNAVAANGKDNEQKTARYLQLLYNYEIGYNFVDLDENKEALIYFKRAEKDYDYFSSSYLFPLTFDYGDQRFSINYSAFEPVQCGLMLKLGELYFKAGSYSESLRAYRKIIDKTCVEDNERYIAYYRMLYSKKNAKEYDSEAANISAKTISLYADMSTAMRKKVTNPAAAFVLAAEILAKQETQNATTGSSNYFTAANGLQKLDTLIPQAAKLYGIAVTRGESELHLKEVIAFAKINNKTDLQIQALNSLEGKIYKSDCDALQYLADEFTAIGETTKAGDYRKQAEACKKTQARLAKKNKRKHYTPSGNSKFDFYAGFNIVGIMNKPEKMDFGVDVNFLIKNFGLELAFVKINQDKDWMFNVKGDKGNQSWDGYKGFIGLKGVAGKTKNFKIGVGPLFGYVYKMNNPIESPVTRVIDGNTFNETFNPVEQQYQLLLNIDFYGFFKFFGSHLSLAAGGSYNVFDGKSPYFNSTEYNVQHPLIAQRTSNYFAPQFRVVWSIGLHAPFK